MKTINLLLLLCFFIPIQAQIVNIPDTNFKNALLNHTPTIDTNGDGEIQVSEAESITSSIIVNSKDISDLTGIEAFINVTAIDCGSNNLTELNCLALLDMTYLDCRDNNINWLSFPNTIVQLLCSDNNLESLDVSNHLYLFQLLCGDNPNLTEINVKGCNNLYQLNFENLPELTSIDLSKTPNLHQLEIPQNGLTSLDVSHLPYLMDLYCGGNQLEALDLSNNPNLGILTVEFNYLNELDLSNNLYIWYLWFNHNNIRSIDLSNHFYLESLECGNNKLTFLDLRNGNNTNINSFGAQNNPDLTCIYVDDAVYSAENWTYIDENSTFVETEVECDALTIDEIRSANTFNIYPNPFMNYIDYETMGNIKAEISIFDRLGNKLIYSKDCHINTTRLNNGMYFIKIELENGEIYTKKIIKVGA